MRFGLSDLEELPSLKEFEALAREALGSDEGVAANNGNSDESVLDARTDATSANGNAGEQVATTALEDVAGESKVSGENEAIATDEQAHKSAAAGE